MTAATLERPTATTRRARVIKTAFAANPKRFCLSCRIERSRKDQQRPELEGRCERCAESGAAPLVDAAATPSAPPPSPAAPEQTTSTTTTTTDKPIDPEILLAVRFLVRDNLTDHEIRVGLRSAWRQRVNRRFTAAAVAAAARAWFADYDDGRRTQGARNTKALRALTTVARMV